MTLTEPTRGTREFLRLREERCSELRRSLKAKGIRIRKAHSPAFEAGARAKIVTEGKGQGA